MEPDPLPRLLPSLPLSGPSAVRTGDRIRASDSPGRGSVDQRLGLGLAASESESLPLVADGTGVTRASRSYRRGAVDGPATRSVEGACPTPTAPCLDRTRQASSASLPEAAVDMHAVLLSVSWAE